MTTPKTILVFGATGGTGQHFVTLALAAGHRIRALVRTPSKLPSASLPNPSLEVIQGSITDPTLDTDSLVRGVDYVVAMLGDVAAQRTAKINTLLVQKLVPSMRKQGVKRFLYQAGGLSRPYQGSLSPILWALRYTIARGYAGQHEDNEAVMEYLATEGKDLEWIVHRAGINPGDGGPSKGTLVRSTGEGSGKFSVANFRDCAAYSLGLVGDDVT
ncbi:hypothetical protein LTR53_002740 [Teratosphaeriaceae sp. CCFEE 6253]|nr:hypothetical protein LTR53_002740 [Teratosphaeriaceae sp. CCFEE 6253]